MPAMLERAKAAGVSSMIVTGGSLEESRRALEVAKEHGSLAAQTSAMDDSYSWIAWQVSTLPWDAIPRDLLNSTDTVVDQAITLLN